MSKILWLDVETTGLNPQRNGIRELGYIIEVDGAFQEEGVLYINPFTYKTKIVDIDNKALELSNVTVEDIKQYGDSGMQFHSFLLTIRKYLDFANDKDIFTIAGFNTKFDYEFLKEWFYDNGYGKDTEYNFNYKVIDVFPLAFILKQLGFIETPNDKLKTLCKYFGILIEAHTALSDIKATRELYYKLVDSFIRDGRTKIYGDCAKNASIENNVPILHEVVTLKDAREKEFWRKIYSQVINRDMNAGIVADNAVLDYRARDGIINKLDTKLLQ